MLRRSLYRRHCHGNHNPTIIYPNTGVRPLVSSVELRFLRGFPRWERLWRLFDKVCGLVRSAPARVPYINRQLLQKHRDAGLKGIRRARRLFQNSTHALSDLRCLSSVVARIYTDSRQTSGELMFDQYQAELR